MFKEVVQPRQFNMIRHLRVALDIPSRGNLRLPASVRAPCFSSARQLREFWAAVAGMRGLWTLSVQLGYWFREMKDQYSSLRGVLQPLLGLSGLRKFGLEFRVRSVVESGGDVEVCEGILELIERIRMRALQPRALNIAVKGCHQGGQ